MWHRPGRIYHGVTLNTLAVLTLALVIAAGCRSNEPVGSKGPIKAWNQFVKDVQFEHSESVWNEISTSTQETWPRHQKDNLTGWIYDAFETLYGMARDKLGEGAPVTTYEMEGGRAVLKYKSKSLGDRILTAEIVKENGAWKIDKF